MIAIFRKEPVIAGLSESIAAISRRAWIRIISRLEMLGFITRQNHFDKVLVDCHPLIREYFADDFRHSNPEGYLKAHLRVYEYLRENTPGLPDSLKELMPLFQAVRHGCLAKRYQEAFDKIYWRRILRKEQYYSWKQLGLFSASLEAVSYFTLDDWQDAQPTLTLISRAEILSEAGICLRALGRLSESSRAWKASLSNFEQEQDWFNSSIVAGNLCETHGLSAELGDSIVFGKAGVRFSDLANNWQRKVINRAKLAYAYSLKQDILNAKSLFEQAELLQMENLPDFPFLSSVQGYYFNDFNLNRVGRIVHRIWLGIGAAPSERTTSSLLKVIRDIEQRARLSLKRVRELHWVLSMALDHLSIARAKMFESILLGNIDNANQIEAHLEKSLESFRFARQQQELPRGLMGRAEYLIWQEEWAEAENVLIDAKSIAHRCSTYVLVVDIELLLGFLYTLRQRGKLSSINGRKAHLCFERAREIVDERGYLRGRRELIAANKALQRTLLASRR